MRLGDGVLHELAKLKANRLVVQSGTDFCTLDNSWKPLVLMIDAGGKLGEP
jgi:hypothetical protein